MPCLRKSLSYKNVLSSRSDKTHDDETSSQTSTSCGLAEEAPVDPAAEEWAARLAAQREGREYVAPPPAAAAARGAGQMPEPPAPSAGADDGDFGGFDGFDEEEGGGFGDGGGGTEMAAWPAAPPREAAAPQNPVAPAADFDVSALEGVGQGTAAAQDDIDWGILGEGKPKDSFSIDGFDDPNLEPEPEEEEVEDDEFTVFDGFGHDNKPTRGAQAESAAGLSWDDERKMWERQNQGVVGDARRALNRLSSASPWDLRSVPSFRSPASLRRFRSQAEQLFEDSGTSGLFQSPTMQRFKRQTDILLGDFTKTIGSLQITKDLSKSFNDVSKSFWSLFG